MASACIGPMEPLAFAHVTRTDKAMRKTSGLGRTEASTSLSDYWQVTPARFHHALRLVANLNTPWCQGQKSVRIGPTTLGPMLFESLAPPRLSQSCVAGDSESLQRMGATAANDIQRVKRPRLASWPF